MVKSLLTAAALSFAFAFPCFAEDATPEAPTSPERSEIGRVDAPNAGSIRNAPSPRAVELAAYIYSASNVCGYKIGLSEFAELLGKLNVKPEDIGPRGPFGQRIQGMFALMSNDMALHRERSCQAVAGEYGPNGNIAKNVLQPAPVETSPAKPTAP